MFSCLMRNEFEQPISIEAEKAVLGGVLLDPNLWDLVTVTIEEDDFALTEHRLIFKAIKKLHDYGSKLDTVTLIESLTSDPEVSSINGFDEKQYIKKLATETPGVANFSNYAEIVKQTSSLRKLISTASDISKLASETDHLETESAFSTAENKLVKLRDSLDRKKGPKLAADLIQPVWDNIEKNTNSDSPLVGHSTGFRDLDNITLGLQGGDLILVAGRPSMGKTAFALSMTANFIQNQVPVLFFSMEMSNRSIMYRLISIISKVDLKKLQQAKDLTPDDYRKIEEAASILHNSQLYIDETSGLTPSEILSRARRLKRENPLLGLIAIDYLQLMSSDTGNDNRVTEMGDISRSVKAIAKEMDVPVVALSQLNRASESRTTKKPVMADLRDSGALEQDADLIMFPFRPEVYEKTPETAGIAQIIVAKHRNGETGMKKLHFAARCARFEDLALDDPALTRQDDWDE
ncbi:replicative DNA helicase [SAR86 cluster bacterium]|nr:replicative DNA helicase [SAR86 cluster bacterium]